jgi:hypothetical protein
MRSIASLPVLFAAVVTAAGLSGAAQAQDLVVNEGQDSIRLTDAACANEAVLQRLDPSDRVHFRSASATLQGQRYAACWSQVSTAVYLVYEDGDQGLVPVAKLKVPLDI